MFMAFGLFLYIVFNKDVGLRFKVLGRLRALGF